MLVIGRKLYEVVLLDLSELIPDIPPIEVSVTQIGPDKIRLGFEAVKRIKIVRKELVQQCSASPK